MLMHFYPGLTPEDIGRLTMAQMAIFKTELSGVMAILAGEQPAATREEVLKDLALAAKYLGMRVPRR